MKHKIKEKIQDAKKERTRAFQWIWAFNRFISPFLESFFKTTCMQFEEKESKTISAKNKFFFFFWLELIKINWTDLLGVVVQMGKRIQENVVSNERNSVNLQHC